MKNSLLSALAIVCAAVLTSCGSKSTPVFPVNLAGSWEFIATSSSSSGTVTGIEVALTEGTQQVNGVPEPDGNITANGSNQIQIVDLNAAPQSVTFGGSCAGTSVNNLTGTVTVAGSPANFTYSEGGNVFAVTATLNTDNTGTTITGSYSPQSGNSCGDSGTIIGKPVVKITGPFNGQFVLPDGTTATMNGVATESSSSVLTLSLTNTANSATFSLSGPVTGNAFAVQGTYQGQVYTYDGYYELTLNSSNNTVSVPTLYLANATAAGAPIYAGSLTTPH